MNPADEARAVELVRSGLDLAAEQPEHVRQRIREALLRHLFEMDQNLGRDLEPDPRGAA